MKISILGRGNIGGNLAKKFENAGHTVSAFGKEGGNASSADVIVVAVPGTSIRDAFSKVTGYEGKVTIDATNAYGPREEGYPSLAELVKSITGGPTAKAFNTNFAEGIAISQNEAAAPGTLFAADPEATDIAQQLIRDAGFDPVKVGDLSKARLIEDQAPLLFALVEALGVPFYYRYYSPTSR